MPKYEVLFSIRDVYIATIEVDDPELISDYINNNYPDLPNQSWTDGGFEVENYWIVKDKENA